MTTLTIQGGTVTVEARTSPDRPAEFDYLAIHFPPLGMVIHDADERKAFIAALQAADDELDAAAERKEKESA